MGAHQRFSPSWGIKEVAIHYAIRNSLVTHFQASSEEPLRVCVEYGDISNVDFPPHHNPHCVDLAILHPLVAATEPNTYSGYAWAEQNKAALGLIEVKIDWWTRPPAGVAKDAEWLNTVSAMRLKPDMRELEWVMLAVFFAGPTRETVDQRGKTTENMVARWGFDVLTQSEPNKAPSHPGSADIADRWFEVMCFGKVCSRGT